jgi:hypothetical protein
VFLGCGAPLDPASADAISGGASDC